MKTNLKTKIRFQHPTFISSLDMYVWAWALFLLYRFFSRDFSQPNWMVNNSFNKTVSNVIIHIKSTSIYVCRMPIIHIIKSWIFWFYNNNMLICWMDGFDQNERSICTCTYSRIKRASPPPIQNKRRRKPERGRSRVESERCLHVRTAFTFTTSCCLTEAKSNYRITRQRRWLVLCALCYDPMLCTWCSRYVYWFDVCMFARLCIYW